NEEVQTVPPNVDLAQIQDRSLSATGGDSCELQRKGLPLREISANVRTVPGEFARVGGSQRFHVHLNRIASNGDRLDCDSQRTLVRAVERRGVRAPFPGDMEHDPELYLAGVQRAFPITFRFSLGALFASGTRRRLLDRRWIPEL